MEDIQIIYSLPSFKISEWKKDKQIQVKSDTEYEKIKNFIEKNNIKYFFREGVMPSIFDNIKPKPFLLYLLGNEKILQQTYKFISIVGPRKPSSYAIRIIDQLFEILSAYKNIVSVSGLANGIDSRVHQLSIKYNIPTIAVLGGGLGWYLQNQKYKVAPIIGKGGLLISEFKLFQKPEKYTFPQRNRIIAGLGDIVFVPEAGPKSGSLITVDFAIQFGKKVFACPGNIFQLSSYGINQYIAEKKVNLVYDLKKFVEDILGKPQEVKQDDLDLPEEDKIILAHIKEGINTVDKLALYTKQDINQILTKLTMLEMKGIIVQTSPGVYEVR